MNIKYAIILFPSFSLRPKLDKNYFRLSNEAFLGFDRLSKFLDPKNTDHWKNWLGTLQWQSTIERENLFIAQVRKAERPNILDQENNRLQMDIGRYYNSLTLSAPWVPPDQSGIMMSGDGIYEKDILSITTIKSYSKLDTWFKSSYIANEKIYSYVRSRCLQLSSFENISEIYNCIGHLVNNIKSELLIAGLIAFDQALKVERFDFKLPNLTRAIESVIAIRLGKGKEQFPIRSSLFVANEELEAVNLDRKTAEQYLANCYEMRNACVHGMWFDHKIKDKLSDDYSKELQLHEFILECAARNSLNWALSSADFLNFSIERNVLVTCPG